MLRTVQMLREAGMGLRFIWHVVLLLGLLLWHLSLSRLSSLDWNLLGLVAGLTILVMFLAAVTLSLRIVKSSWTIVSELVWCRIIWASAVSWLPKLGVLVIGIVVVVVIWHWMVLVLYRWCPHILLVEGLRLHALTLLLAEAIL